MITVEEAKKELREYQQNIKYIEEKQNDALELRTRLESTTKRLSGMPSGKGGNLDRDMLAESIDKMDKIIAECDKKLQELLLKKFIVENKIEQLEQPFKSILFIRYIDFVSNFYSFICFISYNFIYAFRFSISYTF